MTKKQLPGQTRLREILDYDSETGVFTWRQRSDRSPYWNRRYAGSIAGHRAAHGYVFIKIDGVNHYAHRLAWVYVHGQEPEDQVDHEKGNRDRNAIGELRAATHAQNMANRAGWTRKTLPKGVRQRGVAFTAHLCGRHIGTFPTKEEASAAYGAAARERFGAFARPS